MASSQGESSASSADYFGDIGAFRTYYRLQAAGVESVIAWCMNQGLITSGYTCPRCKRPMKLAPRRDLEDQYSWSCRVKGENAHHMKRSIRSGSWFEKSHLPLAKILLFLCMWCAEVPIDAIKEQLDISSHCAADWGRFCREVCQEILIRESGEIGDQVSEKFDSYLAEYMWRKSCSSNSSRMESLLEIIKALYPPRSADALKTEQK